MALFNYATKEITLKIVYYGPGLSGKTTNIEYLHSSLDQTRKGKLLSLSTEADRTLFFDFLPVEIGKVKDFSIRFQLYTVPGQVRYNATRKLVLKGADAVVFVADSQKDMKDANLESLQNMKENLVENALDPDDIPVVMQYNKRDLSNILPVDELNKILNPGNVAHFEAVAITGQGVDETFQSVTKLLLKHIAQKHRVDIHSKGKPAAGPQPSMPETGTAALEALHRETELNAFSAGDAPGKEEPSGGVEKDMFDFGDYSPAVEKEQEAAEKQSTAPVADESADSLDITTFSSDEGTEEESSEPDIQFEDNSIESIYKAFMSDDKKGVPSGEKDFQTFEPPDAVKAPDEGSDDLRAFRDSLRTPSRDRTAPEQAPPSSENAILDSMKEALKSRETPRRGTPEPEDIIPSAKPAGKQPGSGKEFVEPIPAGAPQDQQSLSAAQSILLDEINALSRSVRKINDTVSALKADIGTLSKKFGNMEERIASVRTSEEKQSDEPVPRQEEKGTVSAELVETVRGLKAAVDKAKKRKFWIFFS